MSRFLQLVVNPVGDVTVIRILDQKMTSTVDLRQLGLELNQLIEPEQHLKVLVDLGSVDSISSGVLSRLFDLESKVRTRHGVFKMCGVGIKTRAVLAIAKLTGCFDVRKDKEHALTAFERADAIRLGKERHRKRRTWHTFLSGVFGRNGSQGDCCREATSVAL